MVFTQLQNGTGADKTNSSQDPLNYPRGTFERNPRDRARQQNDRRPEADQGVSAQPGRVSVRSPVAGQ